MKWEKPRCIGDVPTERSGHTFTNVDCFAYMFGGCATGASSGNGTRTGTPTGMPGPTNDLYKLDMSSDSEFYWAKIKVEEGHDNGSSGIDASTTAAVAGRENNQIPCPRWQHTATLIDDSNIVVFGGFSSSREKPRLNDVWILDTTTTLV